MDRLTLPTPTLTLLELPIDILHTVCSLLTPSEARLFRLTCKAVGSVADCHAFPELSISVRPGDFAMLRHFANHPVFYKCVKSLVYFTTKLRPEVYSYEEVEADMMIGIKADQDRRARHTSSQRALLPPPIYTHQDIERIYRNYYKAHKHETYFLAENQDIFVLRDVIPKFVALRHVKVSGAWQYRDRDVQPWTSFKPILSLVRDSLEPVALRQIGSVMFPLLLPLDGLGPRLRTLDLGQAGWSFLLHLEDASILSKMTNLCANLTVFHMRLESASERSLWGDGIDVPRCKATIQKGNVRRLLRSMKHLESLHIGFMGFKEDTGEYPATMSDIIPREMHWTELRDILLCSVEAPRQQLVDFIRLHSSTLETIELVDIRLMASSWHAFVPQLRELVADMSLDAIKIWGHIHGEAEAVDADGYILKEDWLFLEFSVSQHDLSQYILDGDPPNPTEAWRARGAWAVD